MLINYTLMLLLSIHLGTTISANTSISNSETQNLQKNISNSNVTPLDLHISQEGQHKYNDKGEIVLTRRIANTSNVREPRIDQPAPVTTIVTEGSGVSKINQNDTSSIVVNGGGVKINTDKVPAPPKKTTLFPIVGNSTQLKTLMTNETMGNGGKVKSTILLPHNKTSAVVVQNSTVVRTTTTSTTTTSTSTTSTTTTPIPKKPTLTLSIDDIPNLDKINADSSMNSNNNKLPAETKSSSTRKLSVEEPEIPHVQPSQELDGGLYRNHRDYIIPIVSIIFAVPILMGMVIVAYRRFRDFWSTRHYRRMDFLVDGMYND